MQTGGAGLTCTPRGRHERPATQRQAHSRAHPPAHAHTAHQCLASQRQLRSPWRGPPELRGFSDSPWSPTVVDPSSPWPRGGSERPAVRVTAATTRMGPNTGPVRSARARRDNGDPCATPENYNSQKAPLRVRKLPRPADGGAGGGTAADFRPSGGGRGEKYGGRTLPPQGRGGPRLRGEPTEDQRRQVWTPAEQRREGGSVRSAPAGRGGPEFDLVPLWSRAGGTRIRVGQPLGEWTRPTACAPCRGCSQALPGRKLCGQPVSPVPLEAPGLAARRAALRPARLPGAPLPVRQDPRIVVLRPRWLFFLF